jgi:hypothetical protein
MTDVNITDPTPLKSIYSLIDEGNYVDSEILKHEGLIEQSRKSLEVLYKIKDKQKRLEKKEEE